MNVGAWQGWRRRVCFLILFTPTGPVRSCPTRRHFDGNGPADGDGEGGCGDAVMVNLEAEEHLGVRLEPIGHRDRVEAELFDLFADLSLPILPLREKSARWVRPNLELLIDEHPVTPRVRDLERGVR